MVQRFEYLNNNSYRNTLPAKSDLAVKTKLHFRMHENGVNV